MAAIDPDEQEQLLAQERLDAQRRRTALMVVLAGVGVVLALAAGVLVYALTRGGSPIPSVQITTTPVPVPRQPPAAAPPAVAPTPTEPTVSAAPDGASSDQAGTADGAPTPPSPTSGPTPTSDLALAPGNPAGSGCTPGPGDSLPDGQWVGYVVEHDAAVLSFDLVCYDSATGTVTNQNTALREGPLAGDVTVLCGTLTCNLTTIRPSTLTVVDVAGGAVQRVRAGVGPGAPSPRPDGAQESPS